MHTDYCRLRTGCVVRKHTLHTHMCTHGRIGSPSVWICTVGSDPAPLVLAHSHNAPASHQLTLTNLLLYTRWRRPSPPTVVRTTAMYLAVCRCVEQRDMGVEIDSHRGRETDHIHALCHECNPNRDTSHPQHPYTTNSPHACHCPTNAVSIVAPHPQHSAQPSCHPWPLCVVRAPLTAPLYKPPLEGGSSGGFTRGPATGAAVLGICHGEILRVVLRVTKQARLEPWPPARRTSSARPNRAHRKGEDPAHCLKSRNHALE